MIASKLLRRLYYHMNSAPLNKSFETSRILCHYRLLGSVTPKRAARTRRTGFRQQKRPQDRSSEFVESDIVVQRTVKDVWKPTAFTLGVGTISYVGAVVYEYEYKVKQQARLAEDAMRRLGRRIDGMYMDTKQYYNDIHKQFSHRWHHRSRGESALLSIIGINAAVYMAWQLNALRPVLRRYFLNGFYTRSLYSPMILSVFSHYSIIHLALNMYVLHSFAAPMIQRFFAPEEFVSFYLTAGVVSSLAGIAHKAVTRSPVCALGASGAILGCLSYTCMKVPDAQLSIIFLPMFTFSAANAILGIIAFDAAGLVLGFRLFDHAAHLGGTLFGVWYAKYGQRLLWEDWSPHIRARWRALKGAGN